MTILDEAAELINGDRAKDYGDVSENFQRIAALWGAYLGHFDAFTEHDVSMMMILVKVARQAGGYHRDSNVDIAGYAALDEKVNDESVVAAIPLGPIDSDFWDDIDRGILEAQEKRERETTSKPPRSWDAISKVAEDVYAVTDKYGGTWHSFFGQQFWAKELDQSIKLEDVPEPLAPFTEVLS